jgi:hypothetical protein
MFICKSKRKSTKSGILFTINKQSLLDSEVIPSAKPEKHD